MDCVITQPPLSVKCCNAYFLLGYSRVPNKRGGGGGGGVQINGGGGSFLFKIPIKRGRGGGGGGKFIVESFIKGSSPHIV